MATGDKASLLNTVGTELPDNNNGDIAPSNLRTTESAIITYNLNMKEQVEQVVEGPVNYTGGLQANSFDVLAAPPNDNKHYIMRNGEWTELVILSHNKRHDSD